MAGGILDWLTDLGGSGGSMLGGGMGEAGDTSSMVMPPPSTPQVAPQMTGADAPPMQPPPMQPPPVDPSMTDIAGGMQGAGSGQPPMPLPPRPDAANGPPPGMSSTPPLPPPGGGGGGGPPLPPIDLAAAARSYQGAGGNLAPPPASPQAQGILGRALGIDPNREAQLRGSLGAGLKSVGENAHKPGLAAFAGSMGSGIEGGKGATDKTTDQQDRFVQRQQSATKATDERALTQARTQQALADAKYKMTGGKDSVVNSQQQLYLRAMGLVNNDPEVKLAKSTYDNALKSYDANSPEVKAAAKAHSDLVKAKTGVHLQSVGLEPQAADKLGKLPGMSRDNPVPKSGLTKEKFDALPPGSFFINPKDNQLLVKKPPAGANPQGAAQSPAAAPAATAQMTPSVPPMPPAAAPRASMPAPVDDEE